jgi:hypothetical protein
MWNFVKVNRMDAARDCFFTLANAKYATQV